MTRTGRSMSLRILVVPILVSVVLLVAPKLQACTFNCQAFDVPSRPGGFLEVWVEYPGSERADYSCQWDYNRHTYTLVDLENGRTLWTRWQLWSHRSAGAVSVHDSGWVVVHTDALMKVLNPATGVEVMTVDVSRGLNAQNTGHLASTSCGFYIKGLRKSGFLEVSGRLYYVIESGWDTMIVVDLQKREQLKTIPQEILDALPALPE